MKLVIRTAQNVNADLRIILLEVSKRRFLNN